jgi:hypothetical protein
MSKSLPKNMYWYKIEICEAKIDKCFIRLLKIKLYTHEIILSQESVFSDQALTPSLVSFFVTLFAGKRTNSTACPDPSGMFFSTSKPRR